MAPGIEHDAHEIAQGAAQRLAVHEAVCAERYKQICDGHAALSEKVSKGFSSLYGRLWAAVVAMALLELSIISFFLVKFVIK